MCYIFFSGMGNPWVPAIPIGMVMSTKFHPYIGMGFFMRAKFLMGSTKSRAVRMMVSTADKPAEAYLL